MERAFVAKVMALSSEARAGKRAEQYGALVAQIKESDEGGTAEDVATKRNVLLALVDFAPALASQGEHRALLRATFQSKCATRTTLEALGSLLCAVVSNNATHAAGALDAVFKGVGRGFLGLDADFVAPGRVEAKRMPAFATLTQLLDLCPSCGTVELAEAMRTNYPYVRAEGLRHEAYAKFCLAVCERHVLAEPTALLLVCEKALEVDCQVDVAKVAASEKKSETVFELDLEASETATPRKGSPVDDHPAVAADEPHDKLDVVLGALFAYGAEAMGGDDAAADRYYSNLLDVFETAILHTKQSKFVQFAVFAAAATSPARVAAFARRLMLVFTDDARPLVSRVPAVAYLASLLCRSTAVDAALVALGAEALFSSAEAALAALRDKAGEAFKIVDEADQQSTAHLLFALVQALVYVICFRGEELFNRNGWGPQYEKLADEQRWNALLFDNAVLPLNRADGRVRDEFTHALKRAKHKFSDAFRSRATAATKAPEARRKRGEDHFFFPFDPYLLPLSKGFVDPCYRDWSDDRNDSDSDNDDERSDSDDSDDDDDDDDTDPRKRTRSFGESPHSLSPSHMSLDKLPPPNMAMSMSLNGGAGGAGGFFPPPPRDSVADEAW